MAEPLRIQRKRTPGWRMPPDTIYVGRPTKWGNPFWLTSDHPIEREASVDYFRRWLAGEDGLGADPATGTALKAESGQLRGKNLACWCALDQACHADVLLKLANAPVCDAPESQ